MLEILHWYSFNLYYREGKDKILSYFQSISNHDTCAPHIIIPISFNIQESYVLSITSYMKWAKKNRSQTKTSGKYLPWVNGIDKEVDPNLKSEI